jgi:DNA-binding transcriptional ArsR family regulator
MPSSLQTLDAVFAALSDATRRAILTRLAAGDAGVTELAEPFDMSLPAISKHLRVLEDAGLITREKEGRINRCRLEPAPMRAAAEWLAAYRRFWERQLDALDRYLHAPPAQEAAWQKQQRARTKKRRSNLRHA